MANRFQRIIHLLSTDHQFQQLFLTNPQAALSNFDLPEEEREVLLAMHSELMDRNGALGPEGPFPGWNFKTEPALGPEGPFPGWNFKTEPALGPEGPFPGWNFKTEPALGPEGPFPGWNFKTQETISST